MLTLARRDLKTRYVSSYLGASWNLLHPLLMIALYYGIFAVLFAIRDGAYYRETAFLPWFMVGFTAWMLFSETVLANANIIVQNSSMITKEVFPSEVLPVSTFFGNLVTHVVYLVLTLALLFGYGVYPSALMIPKLLLMLGVLFMFTIGVSWIVAATTVFIRDISQILGVVMTFWFYTTPVLIPLQYIEGRLGGAVGVLARLNPMYYIVEGYRDALFGGAVLGSTGLILCFTFSFSIFVAGGLFFRALKPNFAEVL